MSGIAQDVWDRLTANLPNGDNLNARPALPDLTFRVLAAVDADGQRHLLVPLTEAESSFRDSHSRGLIAVTRELVVAGQSPGRHLDIACHDPAGHEAFNLIGEELAKRLALGNESPDQSISKVLAKWRRFWGQLPSQLLSLEEQIGLFSELWFLLFWLASHLGPSEAVARWRGPFRARHDFEWLGGSVEVKGTMSTRGTIHRIHGIEQLIPPDDGALWLFSLRLREEAGAGNTLPGLIARCLKELLSDDESRALFQEALAHAGYSFAHESEYAKRKLRVVEEGLYAVMQEFPRLTPNQLVGGVPSGVEFVEYEISLSGFERLRVARTPSDALPF